MSAQVTIGNGTLRVVRGDITDLPIDAFVFYAREDLQLGSGFGTAISQRGGPSVQEELDGIGGAEPLQAVATRAGGLKARHIIHAVGPKFMEESTPTRLETTIKNALAEAEKTGARSIAFPPMGAGFYGVPLEQSAEITTRVLSDYLNNSPKIKEVTICCLDNREYTPFATRLSSLEARSGETS